MRHRIVVVGGGLGGLVSAARLAHRGYSVDLFEQNDYVGGKMGRLIFDGCTFDTGPSLITMPFVLDQFFRDLGTSLASELDLISVEPACRYRWSDGATLDIPFHTDQIADAVASISPADAHAVERYINDARTMYEATKDVFIFRPFQGLLEFFKPRNVSLVRSLSKLRFTKTLHDVHAEYFKDPRIVQLFDRFATYNGSSPYKAPATLMVIPWVEFGFGAWYPKGGIFSIAEAIERVAIHAGVRIHKNCAVTRIIGRRNVTGVELFTGDKVAADRVISNVDVHTTRTKLLGEHLPTTKDLSCSGLVMLMSVQRREFGLAHHNVLFSDNYEEEFTDIFDRRLFPSQPTIYISRSCHSDASQASPDRENWFVLSNAPPSDTLGDDRSWQNADAVLERLQAYGIQPTIREMQIRSSADMARLWSSEQGALYGRSSNSMISAFLRQQQRSSRVKDLWYVGGSAHPGGGVPLVIISGTIAAQQIIEEDS